MDRELRVEVVGADSLGIELLGEKRLDGERLLFEPRFPWEPGLTYEASYDDPERPLRHRFTIALPEYEDTWVQAVHPGSDSLPANLLKLYVQFSGPMSRGEAYRRLHLVDVERGEVELPFLELEQELWDTTGTRFTLFFDPGRIKREVRPLEEVGPALVSGRTYRLVVDAAWLDTHGQPLRGPFEMRFRVTEPDRKQSAPERWTIEPPAGGTREAVEVGFDEPLDHALLERMLSVEDPDGARVSGEITIAEGEESWSLIPALTWRAGRHSLVIDTRIEDRSGNSVGRPFEVPMDERERADPPQLIRLSFVID